MYHPIRVQRDRLRSIDLKGMVREWIPFNAPYAKIFRRGQSLPGLPRFYLTLDQGHYAFKTKHDGCRRAVHMIRTLARDESIVLGHHLSVASLNIARAELFRGIDEELYGLQP